MLQIAGFVDDAALLPGNQGSDVLDGLALLLHFDRLFGDAVAEYARGIAHGAQDQRGRAFVGGDDRLLYLLMDRGLFGGHEARAHVDALAAQRERGDQTTCVGKATRRDHRNLDDVGGGWQQHEIWHIVLAWMPGAFEAIHADGIDANFLGTDAMAHRRALVDDLDAGGVQFRQERLGVVTRRLHDLDPGRNDRVDIFAVGPGHQGRQDREIDAERLVGHLAAALDLLHQIIGRRLRQAREKPQRARVRDRRRQLGPPNPLHAALHDRVLDAEHFGEARTDHGAVFLDNSDEPAKRAGRLALNGWLLDAECDHFFIR